MSKDKKYYRYLDLIRVVACVAILLYHFSILPGGFLTVCTFFVLSGYLAVFSASKKENFSFLDYYKNRLIKVYIPLLIVVFLSLGAVSLFPDINWLSMKRETLSVLFGYNNFWQLSANQDYFARHVSSPYIHLWYIAILLQFEVVFPFLYMGLKKIEEKTSKKVPIIISLIAAILSAVGFYIASRKLSLMTTYYNTFTRMFSLLFGVALGFIHTNYKVTILDKIKNNTIRSKTIMYVYLAILAILCIFVDSQSPYFALAMIVTTLISCRLIDYATLETTESTSAIGKVIKSIAGVSYEIYLFQYPVIYIFQYLAIAETIKYPVMIALILAFSYFMHFCISTKVKKKPVVITKLVCLGVMTIATLYGAYCFVIAKDYTAEMKQLQEQLDQNEKMMQSLKEDYENKLKQEETNYLKSLEELDIGEEELQEIVSNLKVVGVGDSIMLGAITNLYNKFPNGYIDAAVSRSPWVANGILSDLSSRNMLGDVVVFNLGANGNCSKANKIDMINICGDRKIFWLTVTNDKDVHINEGLFELAQEYDNFYVIDWAKAAAGHPEYFVADKIHLTVEGRQVYTDYIFNAIYNVYLEEYNQKKQALIDKHEEEAKNKITFYGNDVLTNLYDNIKDSFTGNNFNTNKDYTYSILKDEIQAAKDSDTLTNTVVFALDKQSKITASEYAELAKLCGESKVYIIRMTQEEIASAQNVEIIDFYTKIQENEDYLMPDKIHLSDAGNSALTKLITEKLK